MKFALFAAVLGLVLAGCNVQFRVGPFLPEHPRRCGADVDCLRGESCRFPGVDTHAICLPRN